MPTHDVPALGSPIPTDALPASGGPMPLIQWEEHTQSFKSSSAALQFLRTIKCPVVVVAICGSSRTGKSFLLNRILQLTASDGARASNHDDVSSGSDIKSVSSNRSNASSTISTTNSKINNDNIDNDNNRGSGSSSNSRISGNAAPVPIVGFKVSPSVDPCTRGLWLCASPDSHTSPGSQWRLILVDTEGVDAVDSDENQMAQVLALALSLSSVTLLNQRGALTTSSLSRLLLATQVARIVQGARHRSSLGVRGNTEDPAYGIPESREWPVPGVPDPRLERLSAALLTSGILDSEEGPVGVPGPQGATLAPGGGPEESPGYTSGAPLAPPGEAEPQFPALFWVLRDFALSLGKSQSPEVYLESALQDAPELVGNPLREAFGERACFLLPRPAEQEDRLRNLEAVPFLELSQGFRAGVESLKGRVMKAAEVAAAREGACSGASLADYVQELVQALNGAALPKVQSSTRGLERRVYQEAFDLSVKRYTDLTMDHNSTHNVDSIGLPGEHETLEVSLLERYTDPSNDNGINLSRERAVLRARHEAAVSAAVALFQRKVRGVGQGAGAYRAKLLDWMRQNFETRDLRLQEEETLEEVLRIKEEQAAAKRKRKFQVVVVTVIAGAVVMYLVGLHGAVVVRAVTGVQACTQTSKSPSV